MVHVPPEDGTSPGGGFELEDARPRSPRALPDHGERPATPGPAMQPASPAEGGDEDAPVVDTRTVAERMGRAVPRVAGVREPPSGWPLEALRYPVRGHGPSILAGTTAALFALDLLGGPEALRFLSWLLKTPALLFVVRWQLSLVGMSAAGHDEPTGWTRALDVDREGVKAFGRYLLWCFVFLVPYSVLRLFGPDHLAWIPSTGATELAVLLLASGWMAVFSLASAIEEPRLKRPWVTVAWLWSRPLTCLTGSLGWWALGLVEATIQALSGTQGWVFVAVVLIVRTTSVYALMVSARVLGVLGRRVDATRLGPA